MAELSVADLDLRTLTARSYFPSPTAWEDEVLYFLMLDRFSDGQETDYLGNDGNDVRSGTTPPFQARDAGNAPRDAWVRAGRRFCGGTLRGSREQDRLPRASWHHRRLDQSGLQAARLARDLPRLRHPGFPRRRSALRDARRSARAGRDGARARHPRDSRHHPQPRRRRVCLRRRPLSRRAATTGRRSWIRAGIGARIERSGFRDASGAPTLPFGRVDRSAHPARIRTVRSGRASCRRRTPSRARAGSTTGTSIPSSSRATSSTSRTSHLGTRATSTTTAVGGAAGARDGLQFWIAFADVDGFRVDTVKHMDLGASRFFALRDPRVRAAHRQGELLPDRRDHRRPRACLPDAGNDRPRRRARHRRHPGQARIPCQGLS